MDRWQGRVALVTGASAGIGAALCRALVKHGMTVVGCARSVDRIQKIAEDVESSPGKLVAVKCDLNNESEILSMFDEIRNSFGRLDVCVNNAGMSYDSPLLSGDTDEWRTMLNVNVLALCICTREAVKLMREKDIEDGHIVHISSVGGHQLPNIGMPGLNFYFAAKFMVRAVAEGLRREIKAMNSRIRISSVSPGMVQTEFLNQYLEKNVNLKSEDVYSSLQALQSEDIVQSVIYVLSAPQHVEVHDILVVPTDQPL